MNILLSDLKVYKLWYVALFSVLILLYAPVGAHAATTAAEVSIDQSSLTSLSHTPTLSGHATGTSGIKLMIRKKGENASVFSSGAVAVINNTWSIAVPQDLPYGEYEISIARDRYSLTILLETIMTLGTTASVTTPPPTSYIQNPTASTLTVSSIPLLAGGIAQAGTSVPVAYLQMTNTGKVPLVLHGFWIAQNGTALVNSVVGLVTVDEAGGSRGYVGGAEGTTPFVGHSGYAITAPVMFAPGQMHLFTIKAVMAKNTTPYRNTQLMIDVTGIDSTAIASGQFPIRGTTWIITN